MFPVLLVITVIDVERKSRVEKEGAYESKTDYIKQ